MALDKVSFVLARGETLGVVGESGSGKSTLARTLLGLERASGGTASYRNCDMLQPTEADRTVLQRQIQMVFQDPTTSLNPRMTVEEIISEPWAIHRDVLPKTEWKGRVGALLEQVSLMREHAQRYPHQFSGGQRQRIAIAGARPAAGCHYLRRGGLLAGRVRPGADHRASEEPQGRARPLLHLHRPRPARGPQFRRPGSRHAEGTDRRAGQDRRPLHQPAASLHP
ncbi:ATP-binding cassette domain-containing protein [Shinella sp.]|uniref:ATP-binding cassette domain-containing protein n=1 Tax=Shinella sp. TaxID=1870904 RepID=UPI0039C95FA1